MDTDEISPVIPPILSPYSGLDRFDHVVGVDELDRSKTPAASIPGRAHTGVTWD